MKFNGESKNRRPWETEKTHVSGDVYRDYDGYYVKNINGEYKKASLYDLYKNGVISLDLYNYILRIEGGKFEMAPSKNEGEDDLEILINILEGILKNLEMGVITKKEAKTILNENIDLLTKHKENKRVRELMKKIKEFF